MSKAAAQTGTPSSSAKQRAHFQWDDPFLLDEQLTEDERMIRDSTRQFAADYRKQFGELPSETLHRA